MIHCWEHFPFAKHSLSQTHPNTEQCPALVLRSEKLMFVECWLQNHTLSSAEFQGLRAQQVCRGVTELE